MEAGTEARLLLFYNEKLFCGLGLDGARPTPRDGLEMSYLRRPVPSAPMLCIAVAGDTVPG